MRGNTGLYSEFSAVDIADFTQLASFTAEASLLAGSNEQEPIPRHYFNRHKAAILIKASGIVGSTGTPTFLFKNRLGSVIGATDLTGALVGISAAITTGNGITNEGWDMELLLQTRTPGQGANNCTINCSGWVSAGGFAAPYKYRLAPGTPPTATWTQTLDSSVELYPNLSVVCGTSDAANLIRCKQYAVHYFS